MGTSIITAAIAIALAYGTFGEAFASTGARSYQLAAAATETAKQSYLLVASAIIASLGIDFHLELSLVTTTARGLCYYFAFCQ